METGELEGDVGTAVMEIESKENATQELARLIESGVAEVITDSEDNPVGIVLKGNVGIGLIQGAY